MDSAGKYYYSVPSEGSKASVRPSEIMGEEKVGEIPTHTDGPQMSRFSDTDLILANEEKLTNYLVLSDGILVKYDPLKPYDIEKNPSEIFSSELFPRVKNYKSYPDNKVLSNIFSKLWYYFNGGK